MACLMEAKIENKPMNILINAQQMAWLTENYTVYQMLSSTDKLTPMYTIVLHHVEGHQGDVILLTYYNGKGFEWDAGSVAKVIWADRDTLNGLQKAAQQS